MVTNTQKRPNLANNALHGKHPLLVSTHDKNILEILIEHIKLHLKYKISWRIVLCVCILHSTSSGRLNNTDHTVGDKPDFCSNQA